jgi:putative peptidoglycan lipid II flippase
MKTVDLYRASSAMAIGTIISRITGFIRGVLLVAALGTALLADGYNVANTMPNIIYNLVVGGALTAIFVPQLIRSFADVDGGVGFASRLVTTISVSLLALTALGMVFAPALVRLYAPEFTTSGFENEYSVTVAFMRYCLPQIFFLVLYAMLGQVANARGVFAPSMWAPILNNLVGIFLFGGFLYLAPSVSADTITDTQIAVLGWGTTLGAVIQALVLIPVISRTKFRLRFQLGFSGLGRSFKLASWTLVYAIISQLGYLVTVNIATSAAVRSAQEGITRGVGFTPYSNAYLIMLLPYSIVTISIITALLPHLSRLVISKDFDEVNLQLVKAIRLVGVITIPSAVGLVFFGPLITEVLFFGISRSDSSYMGYVLSALGLGLVAFSINIILVRGFNAFEDTKTQVISISIINLISVTVSYLALNTIENEYVTICLGLAFSISYIAGLVITVKLIKKHVGKIHFSQFMGQHSKLALAAIVAMGPVFALTRILDWHGPLTLFLVLLMSTSGYFLVAKLLRITEISMITELLRSSRATAGNRE